MILTAHSGRHYARAVPSFSHHRLKYSVDGVRRPPSAAPCLSGTSRRGQLMLTRVRRSAAVVTAVVAIAVLALPIAALAQGGGRGAAVHGNHGAAGAGGGAAAADEGSAASTSGDTRPTTTSPSGSSRQGARGQDYGGGQPAASGSGSGSGSGQSGDQGLVFVAP